MISVVIPVYNVAPYLREALDSVIQQTYHQLEIIVVDDGSTDGSEIICEEYRSDSRIQIIHQENRGLSSARNAGLDRATGEYIAFLDSDDAFHPDFIRLMLEAIEGVDVAVCQYEVHQLKMNTRCWIEPRAKKGFYNRAEALRALVDGKINVSVWNKLYRKDLWNEIRFPEGHNYEDIDTTFRIFDQCRKLNFVDYPLYLHRKHPGSITETISRKNIEDRNLAMEHVETFVTANIPEVFNDKHLNKTRQSRLRGMLMSYVKGYVNVAEIKAVCKRVNPHNCKFKIKVVCWLIRFYPRLLKILYPMYKSLRKLRKR